jgi:hypothetical protein
MLASAIAAERLQTIARGNTQIAQVARDLQLPKFPSRNALDMLESPDAPATR